MDNKCIVCNCKISEERAQFLIDNNKEITCLTHSITAPIRGIYTGEHGTSDLILCDKVYNDSVRTKFFNAEKVGDIDDEEEEEEDKEL